MPKIIGIRREDLSKIGEKRTPISPQAARFITDAGNVLKVQPRKNPENGEIKRSIYDKKYQDAGAILTDDLSDCDIIFGLKEVDIDKILPEKLYLIFSHTHKGQLKNRKMLKQLVAGKNSLIDYELITDQHGARLVTAFTFFAGYAGMIDSFWMVGKRLSDKGIRNPFSRMRQSQDFEDMHEARETLKMVGDEIATSGTPKELPPFITVFLGDGKTSIGAQKMFDILPFEDIMPDQVKEIFHHGDRRKMYKVVMEIPDMYRLSSRAGELRDAYDTWSRIDQRDLYFEKPDLFESNIDHVLPFTSLLMNCIIWSPKFPRTLPNSLMKATWEKGHNLLGIGDITCDPNGSIEFSEETWIDRPVFIHNPESGKNTLGFEGEGVAVMAVANLPCEFSSDASIQFSDDLAPFLKNLLDARLGADIGHSGLSDELARATILWKGEFTKRYAYMAEFLKA